MGRLSFTDQFFIGSVIAQKLAHLRKVSVVVAGDPTSYHSETVARREGVSLRNFNSEGDALTWLLQEVEQKLPSSP
ncbi:hypothetical protein [Caenimonas soli]|uniref:hypothetical protein n=1 Tax=Caenimonas soli TaxID=2735555 RepID=UPI0015542101|nr:hypothetical protein [Caenimonas soli]NPC56305.1 hypothetical protein [Caenimonas soli]